MLWVGVGGGVLVVILLLIVGLALVGGGLGSLNWKTYRSPGGRYSIDMPGTVKTSSRPKATANGIMTIHTAAVERGSREAYMVLYFDYPAVGARIPNPDATLSTLMRTVAGTGQIRNLKSISINGHPGKEARISDPSGLPIGTVGVCRLYLVDWRLYQVVHAGPPSKADSADTQRFLNSFKLN